MSASHASASPLATPRLPLAPNGFGTLLSAFASSERSLAPSCWVSGILLASSWFPSPVVSLAPRLAWGLASAFLLVRSLPWFLRSSLRESLSSVPRLLAPVVVVVVLRRLRRVPFFRSLSLALVAWCLRLGFGDLLGFVLWFFDFLESLMRVCDVDPTLPEDHNFLSTKGCRYV